MAEPFTIYKLTILYMLEKSKVPMTNSQITNFFLENEYTDYFSVQEVLGNLVEDGLISSETSKSNILYTTYSLAPTGRETLGFFKSKITEGIEEDVKAYFQKNQWDFLQEHSVAAEYRRTTDLNYEVTCLVRSDNEKVMEISLKVRSKEQAEAICRNWKTENEEVYACLMDMLLR